MDIKQRKRLSKYAELNDPKWLKTEYVEKHRTAISISTELGCSTWAVTNSLKIFGIRIRASGEARIGEKRYSKYSLLNDKEWLTQKYVVEGLTTCKIAKIAGVKSDVSVRQGLKRCDIPEREPIRHIQHGISLNYPKLNDRDLLYKQYVEEKRSTLQIGKEIGCSCQTVAQSLRRHGIYVRTLSEGMLINQEDDGLRFNDETISILTGCLLGDAGLSTTHGDTTNANFRKCNKYYDHIKFVATCLFANKWDTRVSGPFKNKGFKGGKDSFRFALQSLVHSEITELYHKWYPESNNRIKIIPEDIPLDPTVMLHWFLDDGYCYYTNRKYSNPKWNHRETRVYLCTQGFQKPELDMISARIKDELDLTVKPRFHQRHGKFEGSGYELEVSIPDVPKFFSLIGPPPVASLAYKWK